MILSLKLWNLVLIQIYCCVAVKSKSRNNFDSKYERMCYLAAWCRLLVQFSKSVSAVCCVSASTPGAGNEEMDLASCLFSRNSHCKGGDRCENRVE